MYHTLSKAFVKVKEECENKLPTTVSRCDQVSQMNLRVVMLAEARLAGQTVGEDVFVEAEVNLFFSFK